MTEAEWQTCGVPWEMLECLKGKTSERKVQLFACASCRRLTAILKDEKCWHSVEHAEASADDPLKAEARYSGEPSWEDFWTAHGAMCRLPDDDSRAHAHAAANFINLALFPCRVAHEATMALAHRARFRHPVKGYPMNQDGGDPVLRQAIEAEERYQTSLLRDIFGNPFRPVTVSPSWRTGTAVSLARQMYESREFSAMPILADALQDAGCEDEQILSHYRGEGPHVRGCWVVDLVLGKQ